MYFNDTGLFAAGIEIVDNFLSSIAYTAHCDKYLGGIRCTIVIKRFIRSADPFIDHIHISDNDVSRLKICNIAGFPVLEECLGLFCTAGKVRMIGIEGSCTECLYSVPVHHFLKFLIIPYPDLLIFM